jgi:Tol biopolymer transport system component
MRVAHRQLGLRGSALVATVAVATLTAAAGGGRSASGATESGRADEYRILLASNRDGEMRAYSIRPDGSRLTPLLPSGRNLTPVVVSQDDRQIAYRGQGDSIYVSRADGTGLRRLVRNGAGIEGFSLDGTLLAFTRESGNGIWIVGVNGRGLRRLTSGGSDAFVDWSPDGKAFVFVREHDDQRYSLIVQPLRGKGRLLVRTGPNEFNLPLPDWSPDGRWIAYHTLEDDERKSGLWLVRPNGQGRHRVAPGLDPVASATLQWSPDGRWIADFNESGDKRLDGLWVVRPDGRHRHRVTPDPTNTYEWSPDAKRLAFAANSEVTVLGVDGRDARRVRLDASSTGTLRWSPDGRRIALSGRVEYAIDEIWTFGSDLRGLRQVTSEGTNDLVGWTPLAPVRPEASPLPPTESVVGADALATRAPVAFLSADGPRVVFVAKPTAIDCEHLAVWTPGDTGLVRLGRRPAPCPLEPPRISELALAGSRVAWVSFGGAGSSFSLESAELADRVPLFVDGCDGCPSSWEFHVHGHGDLLVFNDRSQLVRIGTGVEPCPVSTTNICTTLRRGAHAASVESVSGGLIAIHEAEAVAVLDERGELVRVFPFAPADVSAARLDAGRLVVWRFGVLESYDVATGARELSRPMPTGYRLVDVEGGIAVLLQANSIQLLRLADGRSLTLTPGREPTLADLEPTGLYHSYATSDGGGRLVFVPRADILKRLGEEAR